MTKAFLVGVHEMEKKMGPEFTDEWMRKIGERLAEFEGPGIMGEESDGLYCFRICLFAPKLDEFLEEVGCCPEGHEEILEYVKVRDRGPKGPAAVNVCCSMCHAYRKRRGKLSGKSDLLHLGARYKLTGDENINKEAIKKSGRKLKDVEALLKKFDCINLYV